MTQRSDKQQL